MEIRKLLELFSNNGSTCAERVEFSKLKVNRLKKFSKAVNKLRGYSNANKEILAKKARPKKSSRFSTVDNKHIAWQGRWYAFEKGRGEGGGGHREFKKNV